MTRPSLPLLLVIATAPVMACGTAPRVRPSPLGPVAAPPCDAIWIEARAPRGPHPPALVDLALSVAGRICYRDWLSGDVELAGWADQLCRFDPGLLGPGPVDLELTLRTPPVPRGAAAPPLARVRTRCTPPEPD